MLPDAFKTGRLQRIAADHIPGKGECYVMDNMCDPDSAVVVRIGYFLYDGRFDPHSARNCHYCLAGERHFRSKVHLGCF